MLFSIMGQLRSIILVAVAVIIANLLSAFEPSFSPVAHELDAPNPKIVSFPVTSTRQRSIRLTNYNDCNRTFFFFPMYPRRRTLSMLARCFIETSMEQKTWRFKATLRTLVKKGFFLFFSLLSLSLSF